MAVLDEKQIQEKLYGRYLKGTMPSSDKPAHVELKPNFGATTQKKPPSAGQKKNATEKFNSVLKTVSRLLPWKMLGIIAGCLIVSAILFHTILLVMGKVKVSNAQKNENKIQSIPVAAQIPAVTEAAKLKPDMGHKAEIVPPAKPASETMSSAQMPPASPIKIKQFAVQVCTYDREMDAQNLVAELGKLNFPAFHLKFTNQSKSSYVVFLDKSKSYSDAKARLSEFRKTPLHQKFSDAFIRSI